MDPSILAVIQSLTWPGAVAAIAFSPLGKSVGSWLQGFGRGQNNGGQTPASATAADVAAASAATAAVAAAANAASTAAAAAANAASTAAAAASAAAASLVAAMERLAESQERQAAVLHQVQLALAVLLERTKAA